MKQKLYTYDPATELNSVEAIELFMTDAFETGNSAYISKALGLVARAKGMTVIARKTGLSREQLYRSFSEHGNPTLKTTLVVMQALGLDMTAKAHGDRVWYLIPLAAWTQNPPEKAKHNQKLAVPPSSWQRQHFFILSASIFSSWV